MSDKDEVREVLDAAIMRLILGRQTYGEFDPATDERDLFLEAEEEILDGINYLAMLVLQLRATRDGLVDALAAAERLTGEA